MIDEEDQKFGVTLISWLVDSSFCPFGMQEIAMFFSWFYPNWKDEIWVPKKPIKYLFQKMALFSPILHYNLLHFKRSIARSKGFTFIMYNCWKNGFISLIQSLQS